MIYYDGDAVPELKGMFLFGSFTGDIYALKMSEDKKRIVQEIKIELEHYPFVPTVGIAQSPDGTIYYGGYQIYTLDSIGEREQMLSNIGVDAPSTVGIGEITVDGEQKRIVIDAKVMDRLAPDANLTVRIPRTLLDNITAVELVDDDSQQNPSAIEFRVDDSAAGYTAVTISIGSSALSNNEGLKLAIIGL